MSDVPQTGSSLPLDDIVVLDLTQIYNGPYATFLMARAGATVIKIEPPGGEHLRGRAVASKQAVTAPFAMLNANKRSMCLDLKSDRGREAFLSLVEHADVVVENFTPDTMDRLGLGADRLRALNPRLIYASSSGYGKSGPCRDFPAMDLAVQAMAGVIGVTGFADSPPVKAGPALCDFMAGIHLYGAITTALFHRTRTGVGDVVEVSMMEAIYPSLASSLGTHVAGDRRIKRTGNRHGGMGLAPYNVYRVKDGYVAIITNNEKHWQALVGALDLQELAKRPEFLTRADRTRHMDALDAEIQPITLGYEREALVARLRAHRVPCAPVQELDDVVNDVHLRERGALRSIDHPAYGRIVVPESPLRFAGFDNTPYAPSVELGSDTRHILIDRLHLEPAVADAIIAEARPVKQHAMHITAAGGPEVLQWLECEVPQPGAGELLLRIDAAGVNRHDLNQRGRGPTTAHSNVPGLGVSGTVQAVGPDVTRFAVGDTVCALVDGGGYGEFVVAHESLALPMPGGFSLVEAASVVEAAFTSWYNFFVVANMQPGESALIHGGTSGVGVFAIQMLTALGHPVYVTCGSEDKCRFAEALGALAAINYREESFDAKVAARLGCTIDVALDMSGGAHTAATLDALAWRGRIVHLSPGKGADFQAPLALIMRKEARITGSLMRPLPLAHKAEVARALASKVWPLLGTTIKPQVARVFPMSAAREAHAFMEAGEHTGKVVLVNDRAG